ncbi:hypothetical protein HK101_001412 [Irineochytrium annulatum]|nr:hypothetical protein HK101_001412 [Irineochytrium annulatum]
MLALVALVAFTVSAVVASPPRGVHWKDDGAASAGGLNKRATAHLTYYGGPVIANVEVTTIIYGGSDVADVSKIQAFYAGVTKSAWIDSMAEYSTSTTTIGRGSYVGSYTEPSPSSSGSLTDDFIQTYLKGLVSSGKIKPNANSYYPIHFSPKYSITMQGSNSCQAGGFCAYHGTIDISSMNVGTNYLYYGVLPDQYQSGCSSGCGTSPTPFNNLCSVASHELAEMMTDAAVGLATVIGAPLAWYDQTNGENGDICNAQQGTTVGGDGVTYTVQKIWSNAQNLCVVAPKGGVTSTTKTTTTTTTSTTTTAAPSGTPTQGTCSHALCSTGSALKNGCSDCASKVIAADSYCGKTKWDSICVGEVKTYCSPNTC